MKNIYSSFVLVVLLCFGGKLQAQTISVSSVRDIVQQGRINSRQLKADGKLVNLSAVNGSPYWHQQFEKGEIYLIKTNKTLPVYLRYRIFDDMMEVKRAPTDADETIMNLQRSKDMQITIGNAQFVFLDNYPVEIRGTHNGYALVLTPNVASGDAVLYERFSQKFIPAKPASTPYDNPTKARLKGQHDYFVAIDGKLYHLKAHRRDVLEGFPDHKKALKKFISQKRLKFRGDDETSDMIALVNYYNTL